MIKIELYTYIINTKHNLFSVLKYIVEYFSSGICIKRCSGNRGSKHKCHQPSEYRVYDINGFVKYGPICMDKWTSGN